MKLFEDFKLYETMWDVPEEAGASHTTAWKDLLDQAWKLLDELCAKTGNSVYDDVDNYRSGHGEWCGRYIYLDPLANVEKVARLCTIYSKKLPNVEFFFSDYNDDNEEDVPVIGFVARKADNSDKAAQVPVDGEDVINIDCSKLVEGFTDIKASMQSTMVMAALRFLKKIASDRVEEVLVELLKLSTAVDFNVLADAPYYLNEHKLAAMMNRDLDLLSTKEWIKKWCDDFLAGGRLVIDPADYPDVNLSTLKPNK